MKITDVEAIHLRLPLVDEIADGTQDVLIIRIHTDAGLVGIGEVLCLQGHLRGAPLGGAPAWPWLVVARAGPA
jgi:L-alanine-DL-glutamate epimerase-like enolase superfamily enzyme